MAFRHTTPIVVKSGVILEKIQQELHGMNIRGLDDDQVAVISDVLDSFSRDLPGK